LTPKLHFIFDKTQPRGFSATAEHVFKSIHNFYADNTRPFSLSLSVQF